MKKILFPILMILIIVGSSNAQEREAKKLINLANKIFALHQKHPGDSLFSYDQNGNFFWNELVSENYATLIPELLVRVSTNDLNEVSEIKIILRSRSGKLNRYIRSDGDTLEFFSYSWENYPGLSSTNVAGAKKRSSLNFSCYEEETPIWTSNYYNEKFVKEAVLVIASWYKNSRSYGREPVEF